jgi:hypothetical protein
VSTRHEDASQAAASPDSPTTFKAWARREEAPLPDWWPDGKRGQQAARFLAAALRAAWEDGFKDERVRYKASAWRHSMARRWSLSAVGKGRK